MITVNKYWAGNNNEGTNREENFENDEQPSHPSRNDEAGSDLNNAEKNEIINDF